MKSLTAGLAARDARELADLILSRSRNSFYHYSARSLNDLADQLTSLSSVNEALNALPLPGQQMVVAAARLVARAEPAAPQPGAYRGDGLGTSMGGTVPVTSLLDSLGAGEPGELRDCALVTLDELYQRVLVWPHGDDAVAVPGLLVRHLGKAAVDEDRTLDACLTAAYNMPPVALIARTLGVAGAATDRGALQAAIVAYLSESDNVRALVATAPAAARRYLDLLLAGGAVATQAFPSEPGHAYAKRVIATGYNDQDTVWLASRALVVPGPGDLMALPSEVNRALGGNGAFAFTPRPPAVTTTRIAASRVRAEAQATVPAAVAKVSRLIEELDRQPVGPRKAGGLPVRETRRLAKALRLDETELRFWIGLAEQAGLISLAPDKDWHLLCPTRLADNWAAWPAPRRLALLARTWLTLPDTITWWPDDAYEAPVALLTYDDPYVTTLRAALFTVLAGLDADVATVYATPMIGRQLPGDVAERLGSLLAVVRWTVPAVAAAVREFDRQALHTLYEAELLGAAAVGALTDIGRALREEAEEPLLAAIAAHLPEERRTARFQADMTAVVAGTPAPELAALLGGIAERESEGHAVVYRVSATTVRRAFEVGTSADELLAQLTAVAEWALPQPLEYLVKEVGRAHGRMRVVTSTCCIRSDDESLITELAGARGLAKLGLRRIAPTVLISTKKPADVMAALRAAGYAPALEAATGATVIQQRRGPRAEGPDNDEPGRADALALAERLLKARR